MSGYPLFFGERGEDAELFLANFRMACRIKKVVSDEDCLDMFEVVLRKDASTWFGSLSENVKGNFSEVLRNFKGYFFNPENTQKMWQDIVSHRQKDQDDCYFYKQDDWYFYKQNFLHLWAIWVRNIANPRDGVEILKKKRYIARLFPTLRVKFEADLPNTFEVVGARATKKYRKFKCIQGELPIDVLRPRETSQAPLSKEIP